MENKGPVKSALVDVIVVAVNVELSSRNPMLFESEVLSFEKLTLFNVTRELCKFARADSWVSVQLSNKTF